jgi:hypothetical protein
MTLFQALIFSWSKGARPSSRLDYPADIYDVSRR